MSVEEDLTRILREQPHLPSGELVARLGISRATLMRAVRAARPEVLTIGKARNTAYALRRRLRGSTSPLPVFRVDEFGASHQLGLLHLAHPHGSVLEFTAPCPWPLDGVERSGWFKGLPYFLQGLRPEGFLGRQFARRYSQLLQIGDDPRNWTEEDALYAVSLLTADPSGDLIVGESAFGLWLDQLQHPQACLPANEVTQSYVRRANEALGDGIVGSSAAGEFPKFTALRAFEMTPTHVLVKFSGNDNSPGTQRWSDLLICEHLAALAVATLPGLTAARSQVLQAGQRTFLESVRFDRHGAQGRSALCSWAAINYAWFGIGGRPWPEAGTKLLERGIIDEAISRSIECLWYFGQLIGNTDMHDGNLSFIPRSSTTGAALQLAPVYDMLPMAYAPARGVELTEPPFTTRLPAPTQRETWLRAAQVAEGFWIQAAAEPRISAPFQKICATNAGIVRSSMELLNRGG